MRETSFKSDILIVAIVTIIVLGSAIAVVTIAMMGCADKFSAQDAYIQECLSSERYTREECLLLADVECR